MASLESIFHHMVLPPNIPGRQDSDIDDIAHALIARIIRACDTLVELCEGQECANGLIPLRRSLEIYREISLGHLNKTLILREFCRLQQNHILILYVTQQNAAVLVRRTVSEGAEAVIFEAFEASPRTEDVLAAENALHWDFPSRAAEIPLDLLLDEAFQEALAAFLEQASLEPLECFSARATKANVSVAEVRNTTDPALITQMLMSLLEALGASAHVPNLRKRVRDDVNIQYAELPWRRLPFWLVLRVAIQRQLESVLGQATGHACYKFVISTALGQLLEDCAGRITPEMTLTLRAKLCRRIAKLEIEKTRVASCALPVYEDLFASLGPLLKAIVLAVTVKVEAAWDTYKTGMTRSVPKLPPYADERYLNLSLPNSREYLKNALQSCSEPWFGPKSRNTPHLGDYDVS